MKLVYAIIISFFLCSCSKIYFYDLYPSHYLDDKGGTESGIDRYSKEKKLIGNPSAGIPDEIIDSLPVEFQILSHLGMLICVQDPSGYKQNLIFPGYSVVRHSENLKMNKEILEKNGYIAHASEAYLDTVCFMPEHRDTFKYIDHEYLSDWGYFLESWSVRYILIEQIRRDINEISNNISNEGKLIQALESSVAAKTAELLEIENHLREVEKSLLTRRPMILRDNPPEVNAVIEYKRELDFLRTVFPEMLLNIAGKPWVDKEALSRNYMDPYLNADLVKSLDLAYKIFADPDNAGIPLSPEMIQNIKDNKITFQISSAARTPWNQLSIRNEHKAGTLSSLHLFGLAFDLKLNGMEYDVSMNVPNQNQLAKYKIVLDTFQMCGLTRTLDFTVVKERGHFQLTKYIENVINKENRMELNSLILQFMKLYKEAADNEIKKQSDEFDHSDSFRDTLLSIRKDIKDKLDKRIIELAKIDDKLKLAKENLAKKQRELAEKIEKNRKKDNGDRDDSHREPKERPSTTPRPEKPEAKKPKPEKPRPSQPDRPRKEPPEIKPGILG